MRHRRMVILLLAVVLAACRGPADPASSTTDLSESPAPATHHNPAYEPYPFGSQMPVSDHPLWSAVPAAAAAAPPAWCESPPDTDIETINATATNLPPCPPATSAERLHELWPVSNVLPPSGAMIYTRSNSLADAEQHSSSVMLWQVALPDPRESRPLLQMASYASAVGGVLPSPDGRWIGYLRAIGRADQQGFDLRVVRADGTDDHLVAEGLGPGDDPWCDVGPLLWSRLARVVPVDPTSPEQPGSLVGRRGRADVCRCGRLAAEALA